MPSTIESCLETAGQMVGPIAKKLAVIYMGLCIMLARSEENNDNNNNNDAPVAKRGLSKVNFLPCKPHIHEFTR